MVLRSPKYRKSSKSKLETKYKNKLDRIFVIVQLVGMIVIPIVYLSAGMLDFADYRLPVWVGLLGSVILAFSMWLLWKAQIDLGKNWSPKLRIKEEHYLVTEGVYRYMRHPMYNAHWLLGIAQLFLLQNWIVGPATLLTFLPFYIYRVPREEMMMLEQFGDNYRLYMKKTGRIVSHN